MMQLVAFSVVLLSLCLGSSRSSSEVFEYGKRYKGANVIRFIKPGDDISEVCEGESFMLQCPADHFIHVDQESDIRFGRNGDWESETQCGVGQDVAHCRTILAGKQILGKCEGNEICGNHLHGYLSGQDPCPAKSQNKHRPRKYLTVRYSCIPANKYKIVQTEKKSQESTSTSTTTSTSSISSTLPTTTTTEMSTQAPEVEKLETELFEKLDSLDVINENVTDYVNEFFEQAINNVPSLSNSSAPQTSIMNITERISKKLMSLLDQQDDINSLEFETSQMTLKLTKKKFQEDSSGKSATKWESRDKSISLPDQKELVSGDSRDGSLEIMMAAYDIQMNSASDIISVSVQEHVNLSKPVTFLLPNHGDRNVSCAFWSFSEDLWSMDGCVTLCHNDTHTKCSCDHLTNFALIFNVHSEFIAEDGVHANQLKYITYVGFTISIFCMILTILMFTFITGHTTDRDVIHVNLCICLLTAEVVFMFGIDQTSNTSLCSVIAILLHYFFLSSFGWMFLEGYQIYELLVKVFESSKTSRRKLYIFGYCSPLCIVLISVIFDLVHVYQNNDVEDMCFDPVKMSSYGTSSYCWLAVDNNFILSFIIPAVVVILSNIGMLVFAVHSMTVHKLQSDKNKTHNQEILVSYMKGVGVLMCLLGSTWIFGLLLLAFNNLFIAYAFTTLNSLQGVGIFVFQCLLNPHTKVNMRRIFQRLKANLCENDVRNGRGKYQRTNTYEISDFSSYTTSIVKDENQKISLNPN